MAVGDIVNGLSVAAAVVAFQPAVGVSVCLTAYGGWTDVSRLTDGVTPAIIRSNVNATTLSQPVKLFINNTNYIDFYSNASGIHYSGVQVQ
tara:strand:- start:341 stop:613 length:273 start_codon:yes stop_codon:yes gene_type:complete